MEGWEGINICRAGVSYISLGWAGIRLPDGTTSSFSATTEKAKWGTRYSRGIQQGARGQQGVGSFLFQASFNIPPFCFVQQPTGAAAKSCRIVFRAIGSLAVVTTKEKLHTKIQSIYFR